LCFFIVLITFSDYTKNPKAVKYIIYLLLSLQVSFIYLQAAFSKFYVPEWQNGTAFYYWVYHNTFGSILVEFSFFNFFLGAPIVVLLMTWGAILIELTLAYSLFFSKISKIYAFYLGCVFHLFIMFFLGLGSFSITMMACLVMYCLPQKISINDILQRSNKV
jgi:antimicrobial peptide system SdpB family protein